MTISKVKAGAAGVLQHERESRNQAGAPRHWNQTTDGLGVNPQFALVNNEKPLGFPEQKRSKTKPKLPKKN